MPLMWRDVWINTTLLISSQPLIDKLIISCSVFIISWSVWLILWSRRDALQLWWWWWLWWWRWSWRGGRPSGLSNPGCEGGDSGVGSRSVRTTTANPKWGQTCRSKEQQPIRKQQAIGEHSFTPASGVWGELTNHSPASVLQTHQWTPRVTLQIQG